MRMLIHIETLPRQFPWRRKTKTQCKNIFSEHIANGNLSDGQRNTATLALLLTQEGGPLVIDQPEDELDSNFVFNELIPMLRKVKPHRQLIMATHNANLPVNGDAELVYALEARGGKGEALACGGLDQESVT